MQQPKCATMPNLSGHVKTQPARPLQQNMQPMQPMRVMQPQQPLALQPMLATQNKGIETAQLTRMNYSSPGDEPDNPTLGMPRQLPNIAAMMRVNHLIGHQQDAVSQSMLSNPVAGGSPWQCFQPVYFTMPQLPLPNAGHAGGVPFNPGLLEGSMLTQHMPADISVCPFCKTEATCKDTESLEQRSVAVRSQPQAHPSASSGLIAQRQRKKRTKKNARQKNRLGLW